MAPGRDRVDRAVRRVGRSGSPLDRDNWTAGAKQGVGTAFTYDQPAGDANPSRVWFAITDGAITEGLYPDVSLANIKSLGLLVTDGKSFVADEMADASYTIERLDGRAPAYRVTSACNGAASRIRRSTDLNM